MYKQPSESGFALLITLIVVGVVLSVGLTILDLSIKQVKLSTFAKESESAFHAANAGMECARYWRRVDAVAMETGQTVNPSCFEQPAVSVSPASSPSPVPNVVGDGDAFLYQYQFDWGAAGDETCTDVVALVASSTLLGIGATTTNMTALIPGYPGGTTDHYCEPGARCSVISVRGYNKPCADRNGYGVVQREVLIQF